MTTEHHPDYRSSPERVLTSANHWAVRKRVTRALRSSVHTDTLQPEIGVIGLLEKATQHERPQTGSALR